MKEFKGGKFAGNRDRGGARPDRSFGDRPQRPSFGGGDRGGSRFGSPRPAFGGRPSFGGRDGGAPQMFQATCDGCGNGCEVPFRPTGEKPVYCNNCFKGSAFDQSKNFARTGEPTAPRTVAFKSEVQKSDSRIDELKKAVEVMQSKLDRILHAVEKSGREDTISRISKSARAEAGEAVDTVAELVAETSGKVKKSIKKTLSDIGDSISDMAAQKKKAAAKKTK